MKGLSLMVDGLSKATLSAISPKSPGERSEPSERLEAAGFFWPCTPGPSPRGRGGKEGFTLIELLVSVAIMAVVIALMLPAVQQSRMRARAVQSRSNLARLGEAFHAYHMSQGSLPAGSIDAQSPARANADRFVWGWGIQLLPYLDEANRYNALDPTLGIFDPKNKAALAQTPPGFICPIGSPKNPLGYAACHHDRAAEVTASNRGVFCLNSRVRFDDLVDGSQYSLFVGEAAKVRWAEGTHGSLRHVGPAFDTHDAATLSGLTPQELRKVRAVMAQNNALEAERRASSDDPYVPVEEGMGMGSSGMSEESMPDVTEPEFYTDEYAWSEEQPPPPPSDEKLVIDLPPASFAPVHGTGTQFLLGDGAVRLISKSIDDAVLRRLANRFDHWTTGEF